MKKLSKIFFSLSALLIIIVFFVIIMQKKDTIRLMDGNKALSQEELVEKRVKEVNYLKIAIEKGDYGECISIVGNYTRDLCYKKVAEKYNDSSACSYIEDSDTKDICNFVVQKARALDEKNIEPCNKLLKNNLIKACIEQVEKNNFCENEACYVGNDVNENKTIDENIK